MKEHNLPLPREEDDLLRELQQAGLLSAKIVATIAQLSGFRNVLVHRYGAIDDAIAFRDIRTGLSDFPKVFRALEAAMDKKPKH